MMTISKSMIRRTRLQSSAPSFSEQTAKWLEQAQNRKRNPIRQSTAESYKSQLETNVLPVIGDLPLDAVGNTVVRELVAQMAKTLSPKTIDRNINTIKDIRKSAVDQDGQPKYPYVWNAEMIDAPIVSKTTSKTPIASAQAVQDAISAAVAAGDLTTAVLIAILAGTGMRVNEALAVGAGNTLADGKIIIQTQRGGDGPKTQAGVREVDICSALESFIRDWYVAGSLFPMSESYYRNKIEAYGIEGGFHTLRRFRVTHLRTEGFPEPVVHFWIGHEDKTVTDGYTIVKSEIAKRKLLAEQAGLGFKLPVVLQETK